MGSKVPQPLLKDSKPYHPSTGIRTTKEIPFRCVDDAVLVQEITTTKTAGGIVLPDTNRKVITRGTVLAVGPGRMYDSGHRADPQVQPGDLILYSTAAGMDLSDEFRRELGIVSDDPVRLIRERDIFGYISDETSKSRLMSKEQS